MARKRIKLEGISGLQDELREISADLVSEAGVAEEIIAEELATRIAADTPIDTGDLVSTVKAVGTQVHVGGRKAPHAQIVESITPFIQPNVDAMREEAPRIARELLAKELRR
ncbi:hypothetical protein [Promicromonospora sp. NPDC023805]|uniref:hypothetical protein n=1 Tax=Promicromonospora sp. NPDC023805 TaxID=3154696 RepID=UPI0033F54129